MTMTPAQLGMLMIMAAVGVKLLDLGTNYFFKKLTRDDFMTKAECDARHRGSPEYVKKADCETCGRQGDLDVAKLGKEVSSIKGILLVLAIKAGIAPEELKELTQ